MAAAEVADTAAVARRKDAKTSAVDAELVGKLVEQARASGLQLSGEGGLLQQLTKMVVESAFEGEFTDHLGYDHGDPAGRGSGNCRNGSRSKTVVTDVGPVDIDVPRDRGGELGAADRAKAAAPAERGREHGAVAVGEGLDSWGDLGASAGGVWRRGVQTDDFRAARNHRPRPPSAPAAAAAECAVGRGSRFAASSWTLARPASSRTTDQTWPVNRPVRR